MKNIPNNSFPILHDIFEHPEFKQLTNRAKILYCYLAKLKNRFKNAEWFYRSELLLSEDMRMSIPTIARAKKELIKADFIETKKGHKEHGQRGADWFKLNGYTYKV